MNGIRAHDDQTRRNDERKALLSVKEEEEMIVPRSGVYSTIECFGTDVGMICSAGSGSCSCLLVLGEKECVCSSPATRVSEDEGKTRE